LLGKR